MRISDEKQERISGEKKYRRASRRSDVQEVKHVDDTRYQSAVAGAYPTPPQEEPRPSRFIENSYDLQTAKQTKAAKLKSQKVKADKAAQAQKDAPRHFAVSVEGDVKENTAAKKQAKPAPFKKRSKPKHAAPAPHAAGYKAPVEDPLQHLSESESDTPLAAPNRVGYQSATEEFKKKSTPRRPDKKTVFKAVLIIVAVFFGVGLLGLVAWVNRSVTFTLNGDEETTRAGTPITSIMEEKHLSYTPGNLVSVTGNVLKQGDGNPFSLKLNGQDLPYDEAKNLCIFGEETVELGDGGNVMEPYDSTVQEQQPTLVMDGTGGSIGYVSQWPSPGKIEMRTGKMSGETAPGDTIEPLKNAIITNKLIAPANGEKLVALTFDDGPSEYTARYLQILAQYNAHATFCELYGNIVQYPEEAKAIIAAGNQIISHTKTHSELNSLTPADLQAELSDTFALIQSTTGQKTTSVRPPYGTIDENVWLNSNGLMSLSVLWTQDSRDWERPGASAIVSNALANIGPGSIILMHDGGGNRDQDLEALPQILQTLTAQGYKFVTLKDLLASDPSIPKEIASCDATMPEGLTWPTTTGD